MSHSMMKSALAGVVSAMCISTTFAQTANTPPDAPGELKTGREKAIPPTDGTVQGDDQKPTEQGVNGTDRNQGMSVERTEEKPADRSRNADQNKMADRNRAADQNRAARADQPMAGSDEARQSFDRLRDAEKREMEQQGNRTVQVREMALWGIGADVKDKLHDAMDELAENPDKAHKCVMHAANIMELQSAMADTEAKNDLMQEAQSLRDVAQQIEYRQTLSKDQLKPAFAKASLALARFYQQSATAGLQRADEEQTGYSLHCAAEYLSVAHTYGELPPNLDVSVALLDANRFSEQVIKDSKHTTAQVQMTGEQAEGDLKQQMGASNDMRQKEAKRVIDQLGRAIQQTDLASAPTMVEPRADARIGR